jgi:putative DNA-invertase from lambdoid prophage Rac
VGSAAMKAAIWARVSTTDQETENQVRQLRGMAERRGLEVVEVYFVEASAWKGKHRAQLDLAVRDARAGRYTVLLVWALDRLAREGPLDTLQVVDRFAKLGVQVVSKQEPWTEAAGELRDLLLAIVGWVARFESARRSERTKAGLERVRAEGKRLGRPERTRGPQEHRLWPKVLEGLRAGHLTRREAAKRLGVRYATLQAALGELGQDSEKVRSHMALSRTQDEPAA